MLDLIGIGAGLLGGFLGGKKGGNDQTVTSQNQIDPRLAPYLYGSNGQGGLLGQVNQLQQQQSQNGGLNPMQTAGLELQRQAYTDPRYTAGFNQMRGLGGALMGQGVAGNPFMGGGSTMPFQQQFAAQQQQPNLGLSPATAAAFRPIQAPAPTPAPQQTALPVQQPSQQAMQAMFDEMTRKQQQNRLLDMNEYGMPNSTGGG